MRQAGRPVHVQLLAALQTASRAMQALRLSMPAASKAAQQPQQRRCASCAAPRASAAPPPAFTASAAPAPRSRPVAHAPAARRGVVARATKKTFPSFDAMIAESETPVLVDFYAVWCVAQTRTPRCEARCTAATWANHRPGQTSAPPRCLYHTADWALNYSRRRCGPCQMLAPILGEVTGALGYAPQTRASPSLVALTSALQRDAGKRCASSRLTPKSTRRWRPSTRCGRT